MNPRRGAAALALAMALLLGSCASGPIPKVQVAKPAPIGAVDSTLGETKLWRALGAARSATSTLSSAPEAYNKAVAQFVLELQRKRSPHDWKSRVLVKGRTQSFEVTFDERSVKDQGNPEWSPSHFDSITPADKFKVEHYFEAVAHRGLGMPVVLSMEDTTELRLERAFRPKNGIYVPGTVLLDFGKPTGSTAPTPVRLRIINSANHSKATLAGSSHKLAINLTSMVEANLDNDYMRKYRLTGLLRVDTALEDLGLFGLSAYDPKKIPVIFVHGLNSSPRIWRNMVNEIFANPALNERYQPLLFIYPTGMSVPGAAARLRKSLLAYRATSDPTGANPNLNQMIMIGHSMGGLLTQLQVIETGEELRKAFFVKPIAENTWLTAKERQEVEAALVLSPLPFVKRAIFIATPHRGSSLADKGPVHLAIRLIKLPLEVTTFAARAVKEYSSLLNPALLGYRGLGLSSIDMLSPGHPYFEAMEVCPIKVPFHSIIGDRGRGDGPESSDGVVPYRSSHLEGAQSELIVPYGHSCAMRRETVEEVLRILRLHAGME